MPDPDFRVSGPDFWICILHKSSHLTILPCPDFRVHFHKSSLLPMIWCPIIRVSDPDFRVCTNSPN